MTCLELMKKLRPDLSEVEIREFWCPSSHGVHMAKYPGNESCQIDYHCNACWNREVDEEMVYFQDEKDGAVVCERFGMDEYKEIAINKSHEVMDLRHKIEEKDAIILRQQRENVAMKDKLKELELLNSKLKIDLTNETIRKGRVADARDKFEKKCDSLEERIDALEKENVDLHDTCLILNEERTELKEENEKLKKDIDFWKDGYNVCYKRFEELAKKNKELEKNTLKHIEENEKLKKEVDRTLKDKIDFCELECDFMKMKVLKEKFEKENKNLQDHLEFIKDSNKRLVREIAWYQSKIKKLEDLDNDN